MLLLREQAHKGKAMAQAHMVSWWHIGAGIKACRLPISPCSSFRFLRIVCWVPDTNYLLSARPCLKPLTYAISFDFPNIPVKSVLLFTPILQVRELKHRLSTELENSTIHVQFVLQVWSRSERLPTAERHWQQGGAIERALELESRLLHWPRASQLLFSSIPER